MSKKIIGILGGMGSIATSHFFNMVVEYQQKVLNCIEDEDFYHVIINNVPLKEWDHTGFKNKLIVADQILPELLRISNHCDVIAIPCNTIHYFYEELQDCTNKPIINIIESTISKIDDSKINKVGIIGTKSTNDLRLYSDRLSIESVACSEKQQNIINKIILNIQSGINIETSIHLLDDIIDSMYEEFCDGVILGCTELSLINKSLNSKINVYDSSTILVESLFNYILNEK